MKKILNQKLNTNNKGYSLVELVIVIAILAVLSGGVIYSVGLIFTSNAKSCANGIRTVMSDIKISTMGKADTYAEIYRDSNDDRIYYVLHYKEKGSWVTSKPEKVGNSRVSVYYSLEGSGDRRELTGSTVNGADNIYIACNRSTGSFIPLNKLSLSGCNCSYTDTPVEHIYVEGGNRKYDLELVKLTGKVEFHAQITTE